MRRCSECLASLGSSWGHCFARLGGQMWEIVLVLFVLQRYGSPSLAGLTVLLSIVPGLAMSPVAGALLDRQGGFA